MIRLLRSSVLAVLATALAMASLAQTWSAGRGMGNRGIFPEFTLPASPAVVWKAFLGVDYAAYTPSNALVTKGNVIVAYDKYLLAVSTTTGEPRWKHDLYEPPLGDMLLLDDKIIIYTIHGHVFAIDPVTGQQVWKVKLTDNLRNGPVLANNSLFFTTKSNTVEVVDLKGKTYTVTRTPEKMEAAPVLLGKTLVLCYTDGTILRVEENGISRWSIKLPNAVIGQTPATDGRLMVVSTTGAVYCVNPFERDDAIRWAVNVPDRLGDSALLDSNRVYLATKGGILRALDLANGKDVWTHQDVSVAGSITKPGIRLPALPIAAPLAIGDSLLVRMEYGMLARVNKETGALLWTYQMQPLAGVEPPKRYIAGLPAIDGDTLYFAGTDTFVYRLSQSAVDVDEPTVSGILPQAVSNGYLTPESLPAFAARITDEGSGLKLGAVKVALDTQDLTSLVQQDPRSGYYYVLINPMAPPTTGLHRLKFTAEDNRGNTVEKIVEFILAPAGVDYIECQIKGEFLPQILRVRAGAVISWRNVAGAPRTVISESDEKLLQFSSDDVYPDGIPDKERYVWIVPEDVEPDTIIFFHCRLNGKPSVDGKKIGEGLAGAIQILEGPAQMPTQPAEPNPNDGGMGPAGPWVNPDEPGGAGGAGGPGGMGRPAGGAGFGDPRDAN